jgi:lipid-binding SYLF domain-containing protein
VEGRARAECFIVIPSTKKAAFVFGGEYGAGVMSCQNAHAWSAPVFMQLAKGSWGLQIGAEKG